MQNPKTMINSTMRLESVKLLKIVSTGSFIVILAIHNYFRPYGQDYSGLTKYWLGVMPNFLAALGICLALYSTHLLRFKRFQTHKNQLFVASLILPLLMLIIWEYVQLLLGRPFDMEDIYMSLAGTIVGGFLILVYMGKTRIV